MNRGVAQVARHYVKADRLTEPMLNRVEAAIRCYDPCLSCSTRHRPDAAAPAAGPGRLRAGRAQTVILRRVLVVGYGNRCRATTASAGTPPSCWPPTPASTAPSPGPPPARGLAADISRASLVVLVDASAEGDQARSGSARSSHVRPPETTWSHHLDPRTLAGLAEALYGPVPPVVLVSVAAGSFAEGGGLSSAVERALPEVVEVVAGVVAGQPPP